MLEANSRIGGRIETYTDPSGWKAELGAMRIPDSHKLVNTYLKKFDIPLFEFKQYDEQTFYYVNDILEKTYIVDNDPDSLKFDTKRDEKGKTADQLFTRAVCPVLKEYKEKGWDFVLNKYGQLSVRQYLEKAGLSNGAIKMIGVILNEESLFETSFVESLRDLTEINDDANFNGIIGGSEKLPNVFLPVVKDDLLLNSNVVEIDQSKDKIEVKYKNKGITQTKMCDYAIVTVSAPKATFIDFVPPLSLAKQEALRSLHYDAATKIFIYFNERFWEKDGITGGHSVTDLPSRFIYYPSYNSTNRGGVVLASYTWGDNARSWTDTDENSIQYALEVLSKIHKKDLKPYFVKGVVKRWHTDQFVGGAFALFTPSQEMNLHPALTQPENRILFAGEHTTRHHAWIEGAIESALRASILISVNTFDVVVIGGGPVGLAAAYAVARENKKVAVIERFTFRNQNGSSAGKTRQYREMYSEEYLAKLAKISEPHWRDLQDKSGMKELYQTGYLFFGGSRAGKTTEGDFKTIYKTCESLQQNCEHVDSYAIDSRFGFSNVQSDWMGLYHNQSGYVDVESTVSAYLKLLGELNVTLIENANLEEIIQSDEDTTYLKFDSNYIKSKKIIMTPGAYINDLTAMLGFQINLKIWEMPSYYFRVVNNYKFTTWFYFGEDEQHLFYGFPENIWERPGYVRISPDFVRRVIHHPSERSNRQDLRLYNRTVAFVRKHVKNVNWSDNIIEPGTCLASMVPDGGFVLDFAPPSVKNNKNFVIFSSGWGFKFVPLIGNILAQLAIDGWTPHAALISHMAITRPGVIKVKAPVTPPSGMRPWLIAVIVIGCIICVAMIIGIICYIRRKPRATDREILLPPGDRSSINVYT